jgi:hypothetical protein
VFDTIKKAKMHLQSEHLVTIEPKKNFVGYRVIAMGGLIGVFKDEYLAVMNATMQVEQPGDDYYCEVCNTFNNTLHALSRREADKVMKEFQ